MAKIEVEEMGDILIASLGAIEALYPMADRFFVGIDRDISKELPGLEDITSRLRRVLKLLEDPHPGLFTWNAALDSALHPNNRKV